MMAGLPFGKKALPTDQKRKYIDDTLAMLSNVVRQKYLLEEQNHVLQEQLQQSEVAARILREQNGVLLEKSRRDTRLLKILLKRLQSTTASLTASCATLRRQPVSLQRRLVPVATVRPQPVVPETPAPPPTPPPTPPPSPRELATYLHDLLAASGQYFKYLVWGYVSGAAGLLLLSLLLLAISDLVEVHLQHHGMPPV